MSLPLSPHLRTGVLLAAVAAAAVGLNLGVLASGASEDEIVEEAGTPRVANDSAPITMTTIVDVPVVAGSPSAEVADAGDIAPAGSAAVAPTAAAAAGPGPAPAAWSSPPGASIPSTSAPAGGSSNSASAASPTAATPAGAPTPAGSPLSSAAPATSPAAPTPAPTSAPTTALPPPPPAQTTDYRSFPVRGVGTVVVAVHTGPSLEFWSATLNSGWSYMVEKNRPSEVEVKFRRTSGGEGEAKLKITVENGRLDVDEEH